MRWAAVLLCCTVLGAVEIAGSNVQSVYLMPMSGGLDQYLAHQLTQTGTFTVVTDAKHADAIFTDQLGENFQQQLDKLYPEPKPVVVNPPAKSEEKDSEKDKDGEKDKDKGRAKDKSKDKDDVKTSNGRSPIGIASETNMERPSSSFSHGKGTLFLVDGKSRRVLWSAYARPKNSTPDEKERTAARVVTQLTKHLAGK